MDKKFPSIIEHWAVGSRILCLHDYCVDALQRWGTVGVHTEI